MKAVVVTATGVQIQDVATPTPKPNEVLIRVRACGLNRADLMVASGMAHGRAGGAGTIVGLEFVGLVTLLFRSLSSFRRPFVRKPRGFFHPAMNVADAGYRTR